MSEKVTGKVEVFQTEHNGVKATAAFIDMARGTWTMIVAS